LDANSGFFSCLEANLSSQFQNQSRASEQEHDLLRSAAQCPSLIVPTTPGSQHGYPGRGGRSVCQNSILLVVN